MLLVQWEELLVLILNTEKKKCKRMNIKWSEKLHQGLEDGSMALAAPPEDLNSISSSCVAIYGCL